MNYLTFAGKATSDFGVLISGEAIYNSPERNVTTQEIAGKNGAVVFDRGNFKNIAVQYPAFIRDDMPDKVRDFLNYMASFTGYQRLEDTYYPYYFRLARFVTNTDVEALDYMNRRGSFTIAFDCKPQRFLKDGEKAIRFTDGGEILNRTLYDARPFLRVYGTGAGTVGIAEDTITISEIDGYIDIDCEIMDAYKGATNLNNKVSFSGDSVSIPAGKHNIAFTGNISAVEVTPRWWVI